MYDLAKLKSVLSIPPEFEDDILRMDINAIQSQMKCLVVLGSTGSGKSALCKTLSGQKDDSIFKTSNQMSSVTYLTKGMLSTWYG